MLREGAELNWNRNRVNLPTAKSSGEIARGIPPEIRARSFFSARVAEAHILDRFRQISDDYNTGRIGRDEARNLMRLYARESGRDDGTAGVRNLASTARLNLILDQNSKMARAVGEYERMYSPANREAFPYVIYHSSVGSKFPRSSHQRYDGMIFDKNDPWLRSHWPPWEFGCNCQLENCSAKKAGKMPSLIQKVSPPEVASRVESESGFSFDPAHAFETSADLSNLQPFSRGTIIRQAEEAVRDQKLGNVGLIVARPTSGEPPAPLSGVNSVKIGFESMKDAAKKELQNVGLNPDKLPDSDTVNQAFGKFGKQGKNIPGEVIDKFPKEPFEVAKLNLRAAGSAGLPESMPVILGRGNEHHGIEHLWRNHKELFVDPEAAIRLLKETLGNPNCRIVVSLKRAIKRTKSRGATLSTPITLKRIVLHNPEAKTYCVMVYDGQELKLVSWNNAEDDYGNSEWTLE